MSDVVCQVGAAYRSLQANGVGVDPQALAQEVRSHVATRALSETQLLAICSSYLDARGASTRLVDGKTPRRADHGHVSGAAQFVDLLAGKVLPPLMDSALTAGLAEFPYPWHQPRMSRFLDELSAQYDGRLEALQAIAYEVGLPVASIKWTDEVRWVLKEMLEVAATAGLGKDFAQAALSLPKEAAPKPPAPPSLELDLSGVNFEANQPPWHQDALQSIHSAAAYAYAFRVGDLEHAARAAGFEPMSRVEDQSAYLALYVLLQEAWPAGKGRELLSALT